MDWKRVLLLGVLVYVWPLADDSPINLDAVLGAYSGHDFMELLLHVLTVVFSFLAAREAVKGAGLTSQKVIALFVLLGLSFTLANFDDFAVYIPLINFVRDPQFWDAANAATKAASVGVFCLAMWRAGRNDSGPVR